jgi:hypothetical protein
MMAPYRRRPDVGEVQGNVEWTVLPAVEPNLRIPVRYAREAHSLPVWADGSHVVASKWIAAHVQMADARRHIIQMNVTLHLDFLMDQRNSENDVQHVGLRDVTIGFRI